MEFMMIIVPSVGRQSVGRRVYVSGRGRSGV
jgi:hypothetical protein